MPEVRDWLVEIEEVAQTATIATADDVIRDVVATFADLCATRAMLSSGSGTQR